MKHTKSEKAQIPGAEAKCDAAPGHRTSACRPETVATFIEEISTKVDELLAAADRKFRAA